MESKPDSKSLNRTLAMSEKAGTCSWSDCISSPNISSFVGHGLMNGAVAPCVIKKGEERRKKRREVLHLFRCYTHTHTPGRSRVNPERQEEEKSGHRRRAKGQNSAGGGEGNERTSRTNLHGETDLTKTEHTPKTPRHITERHAGRIRDQMGD